ncbi:DUF2304 domain-containing protein [Pseudoclavibacter sp. CFCC 13611]|uniref:DUF2304 domain-containing protein n=1 Tax=Pseudoclavibacter sp. CFCC 13611 TaxID=2615178 RepID=UPI001CE40F80|nr:DUF2304 domain-containing protein [Pseudoclavibacter sp. CFCC 13611]
MRILAAIFVLAVLVLLFDLVRRQKLKEKYAILWMTLGVATLVLAVFPRILYWLSALVGVQIPSNLLFAMTLALLVGVSVHLSWELSRSEGRTRRLAEEVAILRTQTELMDRSNTERDRR